MDCFDVILSCYDILCSGDKVLSMLYFLKKMFVQYSNYLVHFVRRMLKLIIYRPSLITFQNTPLMRLT